MLELPGIAQLFATPDQLPQPERRGLAGLTATALVQRLKDLAGDERGVQAVFLLHLEEFDRRRGYLDLSTVTLLGQVFTEDNFDDLVARAAYKTKTEVDHLVASLRPREAPRDGIRRLPLPAPSTMPVPSSPAPSSTPALTAPVAKLLAGPESGLKSPESSPRPQILEPALPVDSPQSRDIARSRAEIRAAGRDEWSLRVTIDGACKSDLEMLQHLLSHKCGRDLASALREAIRCGIEKHGKRRGAVPTKRRNAPPTNQDLSAPTRAGDSPRDHIPAAVKQAVYERDGGCCSFVAPNGRRCGSRGKLEFDHAHAAFLDGPATIENVRLLCRAHNVRHAEQVFGREHMDRFRTSALPPVRDPVERRRRASVHHHG